MWESNTAKFLHANQIRENYCLQLYLFNFFWIGYFLPALPTMHHNNILGLWKTTGMLCRLILTGFTFEPGLWGYNETAPLFIISDQTFLKMHSFSFWNSPIYRKRPHEQPRGEIVSPLPRARHQLPSRQVPEPPFTATKRKVLYAVSVWYTFGNFINFPRI